MLSSNGRSSLYTGLNNYYPLNGNSQDLFTNRQPSVDTDVNYTTPKLGSACAAFNGTTSKIVTAVNGPLGAAAWSVSMWAYRQVTAAQTMGFGWGSGAGTSVYLLVDATNAYLHSGTVYTPAKAFSTGTWHHVVCTYDGTTANLYLDNGTPATNVMVFNSSASPIILGNYTPQTLPWNGLIDDAVMWDRALTAGEVASLYNSGSGIETMSGTLLTGLIHQWHLNGNSTDNVGSANGTDTAVTYGGKLGQCAMFNGTTSKIQTAVDGPTGAAARSISMWLYHSVDSTDGCIFMGTGSGTALSILHYASTGALVINDTLTTHCSNTMTLNSWHHVVFTYSGTVGKLYVDGGTPTTETWTLNTAAGVIVLGNFYASANLWQGLIDEVGMWNRALDAGEVASLYNAGNGTTDYSGSLRTGLIHRWALDGSSVDTMAGNGTDTDMDFPHPKLGSGCGVFTGSSSSIQTTLSTPSGAGARSFSFWYNSLNILNRNVLGYGSYGSAQQFVIKTVGDSIYFDPYGAQYLIGTGAANTWHHVVVTYDGTTVQGYFDNVASTPVTLALNTGTTYKLAFGLFAYPPSYQGNLDDIVMWDKALTAGEVASLWNSGSGIETMSGSLLTNLTHQWHLNGNALDNVGTEHGVATSMTYDPLLGSAMFHSTPNMNVSRQQHTATRLANGKVLVTGGINEVSAPVATCEIYDPTAATWTATGSMAQARYDHTAQVLPSGKVLVVGGTEGTTYLATCEIYDPTAGTWASTGSLTTARIAPTVTLADGKILVSGGQGLAGGLDTCEIFDESTGLWTATGSMGRARYYHAIAAMADGNILATGGRFPTTNTAEVYNTLAGTWSNVGSMSTGRYYHTMNLLSSGKVLVADGYVGGVAAELYDPTTQTFSTTGRLGASRNRAVSTTLSTGGVLVTGGIGVMSAEIYTPSTNGWKMTENMPTTRYLHTSTLLTNGSVLVAGGYFGGTAIPAAEIYTPGVSALLGAYATFNGSTSKIQTSYLGPSGAAPRSLSVWLKPSATQTKRVCGYGTATTGGAFQAYLTGGNIYIDTHGTTYDFGTCSSGVWHHFCATYDGTTLRGYVDGVAGTPVTVTLATAATGPFLMGGGPSGTGYSGSLDDVALYTRALVPAEVAKLYNAGVGNPIPF